MAAGSTLSRRVSEFLGVVLFAAALIWLIALVTYDPSDPTWFFNTGATGPPANFIGRVGAFLAELVVSAVRLRGLPRAGPAGRRRVAPVLVPGDRRGVHEARRRRAAVRLRERAAGAGARRRRPVEWRRRVPRRRPREPPVRLPQPDRLDHRHPDAAHCVVDPLHAVLVRPLLLGHRSRRRRRVVPRAGTHPGSERGEAPREAAPGDREEAHGDEPGRREGCAGQGCGARSRAREGGAGGSAAAVAPAPGPATRQPTSWPPPPKAEGSKPAPSIAAPAPAAKRGEKAGAAPAAARTSKRGRRSRNAATASRSRRSRCSTRRRASRRSTSAS